MEPNDTIGNFGTPTIRDRIRSQADDALAALMSARKQVLKDYDADIRAVRELQSQLRDRDDSGAMLFENGINSLSPKLLTLLKSPLARYR